MGSSKFDVLVALVLSGEANEKQKTELEEILNSSVNKKVIFEKLKRVWQTDLSNNGNNYQNQKEHLWTMYQKAVHTQKRRKNARLIYRVAATIVFVLASALSIYLYTNQTGVSEEDRLVAIRQVVKEARPGEKLTTKLPDGTVVYLNAGSKLVFPEYFSDSARVIKLIGEGYFDVFEDKARPFTVQTASMDITALGTEFGVNAYSNNRQDQVALVSGKLLIKNIKNQEVRIDSGQTVTLSRENYSFTKSEIDYLSQVAWKDGILYFQNSSFEDIVKKLELTYGVQFTTHEKMNAIQYTYTGTFKNESLENVLEILSFSMDFKYEMNGIEILIKK